MAELTKEENIVFLDIETVPSTYAYGDLNDRMKKLWDKKAGYLVRNNESPEELYPRAGIYAEFGKVICICAGLFQDGNFVVHSFTDRQERGLLLDFAGFLHRFAGKDYHRLCAHNGIEFDFPYIARRMLINDVPVPKILDTRGKKPWEVQHLDTMHLWRFGDFKAYTSLDLLTAIFDIPTPKDDIDGSMVYQVYYNEINGLQRIMNYCKKDTLSVAQLYRKYQNLPLIPPEKIIMSDEF